MRHVLALLLFAGLLTGCRSVDETRALRGVDFSLAGVRDAALAGVPLDSVEAVGDVGTAGLAVITAGVLRGELPLRFGLVVGARNPATNPTARLARFDWTLFLDDREAATGTVERGPTIAPGDSVSFTVPVEVDLVEVAGRNAAEIVRMALAVAGRTADPTRVRVEARPYVETPLGSLPLERVTVVSRTVGPRRAAPADTTSAPR
jgi:hypothetical protein